MIQLTCLIQLWGSFSSASLSLSLSLFSNAFIMSFTRCMMSKNAMPSVLVSPSSTGKKFFFWRTPAYK